MLKKTVLLTLSFVLLLGLCSCGGLSKDYLMYQKYPLEFSAGAAIDGNEYVMSFLISDKDNYRICFEKPENIKGYCLSNVGGELSLSLGELNIPIDDSVYKNGIDALSELFFLNRSDISDVTVTEQNGLAINVVKFNTDFGTAEVYLDAQNDSQTRPLHIKANLYGRDVALDIYDFKNGETAAE